MKIITASLQTEVCKTRTKKKTLNPDFDDVLEATVEGVYLTSIARLALEDWDALSSNGACMYYVCICVCVYDAARAS